MDQTIKILRELLRLALWGDEPCYVKDLKLSPGQWALIMNVSLKQGIQGLVLDSLGRLERPRPPRIFLDQLRAIADAQKQVYRQHLKLIAIEAENMEEWFAPQEIDIIHLNFSDPWPKKKTHKRRLSSERFLGIYRKVLNENGEVRMKTDNKDLFEDSVTCFSNDGWIFDTFSVDYRRIEHPEDAITEYEAKFMEAGQPIYRFTAVKERRAKIRE